MPYGHWKQNFRNTRRAGQGCPIPGSLPRCYTSCVEELLKVSCCSYFWHGSMTACSSRSKIYSVAFPLLFEQAPAPSISSCRSFRLPKMSVRLKSVLRGYGSFATSTNTAVTIPSVLAVAPTHLPELGLLPVICHLWLAATVDRQTRPRPQSKRVLEVVFPPHLAPPSIKTCRLAGVIPYWAATSHLLCLSCDLCP